MHASRAVLISCSNLQCQSLTFTSTEYSNKMQTACVFNRILHSAKKSINSNSQQTINAWSECIPFHRMSKWAEYLSSLNARLFENCHDHNVMWWFFNYILSWYVEGILFISICLRYFINMGRWFIIFLLYFLIYLKYILLELIINSKFKTEKWK